MKDSLSQQGRLDFTVSPKLQTVWGFREGMVFALEGISASLFLGFMFLDVVWGMILGVVLLVLAVLLLLSHLGHPFRAWKAILNVRRSWLSRGTITISAFIGMGALYVGVPLVLGWELTDGLTLAVQAFMVLAGVFILLYPGLAMSASPAIPFWSTGLLPVLSLVSGLASGGGVVLAYLASNPQLENPLGAVDPAWMQMVCLIGVALMTLVYMTTMRVAGTAASLSVSYLVKQEPVLFWVLTVGAGIVIPVGVVALVLSAPGTPAALLWAAAAARVVGDICGRYAWLKAGIFDAVLQPTRRV